MIYFMGHILQHGLECSLANDTLVFMSKKIGRRVLKLGLNDEPTWVGHVCGILDDTHCEVTKRWSDFEQDPDPCKVHQAWQKISNLSFDNDTALKLDALRPYLTGINTRTGTSSADNGIDPHSPSPVFRPDPNKTKFPEFGSFSTSNDQNDREALMDVELWVQKDLEKWLLANLISKSSCSLLASLIENYYRAATVKYTQSPEDMSLMILTIMDLWVALDKCVTDCNPLLSEYDTGYPPHFLYPLILPKKVQMERLSRVELYIQQRKSGSKFSASLIFMDLNEKTSFGVRYFDANPSYKTRLREIEAKAGLVREEVCLFIFLLPCLVWLEIDYKLSCITLCVTKWSYNIIQFIHIERGHLIDRILLTPEQKKKELIQQRKRYDDINEQARSLDCEKVKKSDGWEDYFTHNHKTCQKCRLNSQANAMKITVHEWPLPYDPLEAKAAVFGLDVPTDISWWYV
jgi:hypothetical protein